MNNQKRNSEDIEIPWALVKEFTRCSTLPPAVQTSGGNPRMVTTPRLKHRGTPLSVDAAMVGGDRSQCYNTPQFPSLPASPDLVSPFRRHQDKKVPFNVLHAYVVGSTPPVQPVNTTFSSKTSPRVAATKRLSQARSDVEGDSKSPICPTIQRIVKTRQGKRRSNPVSEIQISKNEECHMSTEFPQVSPLGYMHHYSQMWSPVEEKKLVEIWKKGHDVKKPSCNSTTNKCTAKPKPVSQFLLATTNNRGRDFTSNERASMFRYREVITSNKSEPPTVATSPASYITTWLEAGGEVPNFLKSV